MKPYVLMGLMLAAAAFPAEAARTYTVTGTGQNACYDEHREIPPPNPGQPFHGQDAQHPGPAARYQDNGDGTVSDLNTGLMWAQTRGTKVTWADASAGASACRTGEHADWRMPRIKELYSLINFTGSFDGRGGTARSRPYIDTRYFGFQYGDEAKGERGIDCQDWSATSYTATTMNGNPTAFGVNFADGRIKGYPKTIRTPHGPREHTLYVRYVRGNPLYGQNDFHDNGDGTVTDRATGLVWQQADSGKGLDWKDALAYAEQLRLAGHEDWRLPDAKELQSIVDYTHIPAIDPVFHISKRDDGEYPFYWSSTTHLDGPPDRQGGMAVYVCFGRALGWMSFPPGVGEARLMDVHGAGAQRSDPKVGDPRDYPRGHGPQGDVVRIYNCVRCVRDGES